MIKLNKELKNIIKVVNKVNPYDVVIYDMRPISPFYDYSIICSVSTSRSASALVQYLKDEVDNLKMHLIGASNNQTSDWYYVDLNNVIVHIFVKEERDRFNLDGLYYHLDKLVLED